MPETTWWKHGIIYQIYPRSFQDTNGDGIGDLNGIRRRLDHLAWLGVDAIWISPIFTSPMADFGYDVADYCGIDPIFGTLEDFDRLVADTHARGLKLILDFVPNHTSDRHPWFRESRSSRSNPKRDWYIWRDPGPDGGPPNNWMSNFGGPAWEWDEATGQYYYHAFLREQPDLNWRNPEVRAAMYDVLRFWLDRGVDGFRVDVIWHLIKDAQFRDNPPNPGYQSSQADINRFLQVHSADQPEVHEVVADMRKVLEEYEDRVLIGEIYLPLERLVAYYGADLSGAHLPFNFQLIHTAWNAREIAQLIKEYEGVLPGGGWPNWVLGNHDQPRIGARVGPAQARVAAMLLLTLRGTPTLYYGDEIGIGRVEIPADAVQDPWEKNEPGLGLGRDPERTPMHWDGSPNAGFTSGRPWLPVDQTYTSCNVEALSKDPTSILTLYRRLIEFRGRHPALSIGRYGALATLEGDVLAYERQNETERLVVVLNLGHQPRTVPLVTSGGADGGGRMLLSTHLDREGEKVDAQIQLRPDEGVIIAL
ncbi:MAG TPA: alpha-amylase family glycosyl hydrolase [Azospirillaceae bacterium]|nr:alpha-amylase family glycosyl hydrolase [Azospirillaceae bacterium]